MQPLMFPHFETIASSESRVLIPPHTIPLLASCYRYENKQIRLDYFRASIMLSVEFGLGNLAHGCDLDFK